MTTGYTVRRRSQVRSVSFFVVALAGVGLLGNSAFNIVVAHEAGIRLYALVSALMSLGVVAGCLCAWLAYTIVSRTGELRLEALSSAARSTAPVLLVLGGLAVAAPAIAHYLRASSTVAVAAALGYFLVSIVSAVPMGMLLSKGRFGTLALTTVVTQVGRISLALPIGLKVHPDDVVLLTSTLALFAMACVNWVVAGRTPSTRAIELMVNSSPASRSPVGTFDGGISVLAVCLFLLGPLPVAVARHDLTSATASQFATGQTAVNAMVLIFVASWIVSARLAHRQFVSLIVLCSVTACGLIALVLGAPTAAAWVFGVGFAPSTSLVIELTTSAAACGVAAATVLLNLERRSGLKGSAFLVTAIATELLVDSLTRSGGPVLALSPAIAFACGGAALMLVAPLARRSRHRVLPVRPLHLADVGARSGLAPSDAPSLLEHLTIGVMAHNEILTIRRCLQALLAETEGSYRLARVVVVVSGSTDGTDVLAQEIARASDRVDVIVEPRRTGKVNAINLFLDHCTTPLLGLVSADVLLAPGSLTVLADAFRDESIGMAGGRVSPQNEARGLSNALVHLQWELHDLASRRAPKLGEVILFRRVFSRLEGESLTDEVSIEALLTHNGYGLVYVPEATVLNFGPTKFADYMRHRSRIHAGHLLVRRNDGYTPSTMRTSVVLRAAADCVVRKPAKLPVLVTAFLVELCVRLTARLEVHRRLLTGDSGSDWIPITSAKMALPVVQASVLQPAVDNVEASA